MNEHLIGIVKYVIAPAAYLSLAIYVLWTVWNRWVKKEEEEEED